MAKKSTSLSKTVSPVYSSALTKRDFDTLCLDNLDESRRSQIMTIKDSIALSYEDTLIIPKQQIYFI